MYKEITIFALNIELIMSSENYCYIEHGSTNNIVNNLSHASYNNFTVALFI